VERRGKVQTKPAKLIPTRYHNQAATAAPTLTFTAGGAFPTTNDPSDPKAFG